MTPRRLIAVLFALLIVGVPGFALPGRAVAAPGGDVNWSIAPSGPGGPDGRTAFDLKGPPGQQIADHVAVANLGAAPLTVTVYPTDAFTASDGSFALLTAGQSAHDLGSWTDLSTHEYTIAAHKQLIIPFRLNIPANATPGDHAAGIIASVLGEGTTPEGNAVKVDRRVAARIYVRVAGPVRASAEISSVALHYQHPGNPFASGTMQVTYLVRNTGNIRFHGTAKARIQGPLGIGLAHSDALTVPELLPGAEVMLTTTLRGIAPVGRLTGSVTLNPISAEGNLPGATRSSSVWASPWLVVGVAAVVVLVIVMVIRRRVTRRRSPHVDTRAKRRVVAAAR